jgi:hypothetical protein
VSTTIDGVSVSSRTDTVTIGYRIDQEDRVVWTSDSWSSFANANGWPDSDVLGTSLWDAVAGAETSLIWHELVARVRKGVAINVPFRCDSPGARRYLELMVSPGAVGEIEFRSRTTEIVERDPIALMSASYADDEAIRCCSWCKRFDARGWVEVEEAVARLGLLEHEARPVTHAMCPECEVSVRGTEGL